MMKDEQKVEDNINWKVEEKMEEVVLTARRFHVANSRRTMKLANFTKN